MVRNWIGLALLGSGLSAAVFAAGVTGKSPPASPGAQPRLQTFIVQAPAAPAPEGAVAPAPPSYTALWDQPTAYGTAIIDQDFPDVGVEVLSADDFQVDTPWNVFSIFVDGASAPLSASDMLHWAVYADSAGLPSGYPGGPGTPVWHLDLLPTNPAVTYSGAIGEQATLDVAAAQGQPLVLQPGRYWFFFYPTLNFGMYGQWFWDAAAPAKLNPAQVIDPSDVLGLGWTAWTPWPTVNPAAHDAAFRMDGFACLQSGQVISDGSFELGSPNPFWGEATTSGFAVIWNGPARARTGAWFAWFGGIGGVPEAGTVTQTVIVDPGFRAMLSFWLHISLPSGNGTDNLTVSMDGANLLTVLENDPRFAAAYAPVSLDLSSYADGVPHTLALTCTTSGLPVGANFDVDDVSVDTCKTHSTVLYDDFDRASFCVNEATGAYTHNILAGPYAPAAFAGNLMVLNGGTLFWSVPGDPTFVYAFHDKVTKKGWVYMKNGPIGAFSQVWDHDTTDTAASCTP